MRFDHDQHIKSQASAPGRLAGDVFVSSKAPTEMTSSHPRIHRGEDVVELQGGQERAAMIEHMRSTIAGGTYDIMSRLDVATEGLLEDLGLSI